MTLYLSLFGLGISILLPHIEQWWVWVSGSFFSISSKSFRSLRTVSESDVVHPIWSVYASVSSDIFFALRPSLILIRLPLFFPIGGCPGLPFFGGGLLRLPCGLPFFGGGLLRLPCGLPFGGAVFGGLFGGG